MLSLCLTIKHYAMKVYGGVDVSIHVFLTSALVAAKFIKDVRYKNNRIIYLEFIWRRHNFACIYICMYVHINNLRTEAKFFEES
jgi:hypothetical protein